jgi:hypothetical protein
MLTRLSLQKVRGAMERTDAFARGLTLVAVDVLDGAVQILTNFIRFLENALNYEGHALKISFIYLLCQIIQQRLHFRIYAVVSQELH